MLPRILLADDHPTVRSTLRRLLEENFRVEIVEAQDGREAIAKASESRPNVAILDLAMPLMDGLTSAAEISKTLPGLPILIYTMHWAPHLEVEALKYGVRKVISKSQIDVLVSEIQEVLAQVASGSQETSGEPPVSSLPDEPSGSDKTAMQELSPPQDPPE